MTRFLAAQAPRTADGHPDLQGTWSAMTLTPLERPAEFKGKANVTDEEARAYEKKDHANDTDAGASAAEAAIDKAEKAVGARDSQFWDEAPQLARVHGMKRTSLIVDPPDGKMPTRTPEGTRRMEAATEAVNRYDRAQDRPLSERCLPDSEIPIIPSGVNDFYQIVQTPDHIMILAEIVHDARIVRMNGTHPPAGIRQWLGDSIGHWEGDTLVVDTTNFNDQLASAGTSGHLHVIEQFSLLDANTLLYRATVDDPEMFQKTWTIEYPWAAAGKPIFEYACHEGNSSLSAILAGARKSESGK